MISDAECEEKAIACCKLMDGNVSFTLAEETEVSLGIIVNLTGQASFGINAFKLEGVTIEQLTPEDPTGIKDLKDLKDVKDVKDLRDLREGIYDLSGRKVADTQLKSGIYIKEGKKVLVK